MNIPMVLNMVILGWSSHRPNRQRYSPIKFMDPGVLMCARAVINIRVERMGVV